MGYKDINDMIAEHKGCMTWDELMQKFSRVCKERDELRAQINRLVKQFDDETEKAYRLERENMEKEKYIAEVMGNASNGKS